MSWTKEPQGTGWYRIKLELGQYMALVYTSKPTSKAKQNGSDTNPFVLVYRDDSRIGSGCRVRDLHGRAKWFRLDDAIWGEP